MHHVGASNEAHYSEGSVSVSGRREVAAGTWLCRAPCALCIYIPAAWLLFLHRAEHNTLAEANNSK